MTLEDNTIVQYKTDNYYAPNSEGAILWNDEEIGIKWPIGENKIILSEKDSKNFILKEATIF